MTSEQRRKLREKRISEALSTNNCCNCSDCGGCELIGECLYEIRARYKKSMPYHRTFYSSGLRISII